jgi:hypothetical protein
MENKKIILKWRYDPKFKCVKNRLKILKDFRAFLKKSLEKKFLNLFNTKKNNYKIIKNDFLIIKIYI